MYKSLYDSQHRFRQISADPNERNTFKQKGLREKLLCESCEQQLSIHEQYVSNLISTGAGTYVAEMPGFLHLSRLNYTSLKIFQLSVLWRCAISELPAFAHVNLGPHEAKIREMVLNNDPGEAEEYGCIMGLLLKGNIFMGGLMVPPTRTRSNGHVAYRLVLGGIIFVYIVSSHLPKGEYIRSFAQQNGTAYIKLQQFHEMEYLVNTVADMKSLGKFNQ